MRRSILLLLAGTAFGAVATYTLMPPAPPTLASIDAFDDESVEADANPARWANGNGEAAANSIAQRLGLYRMVATADERALRSLIQEAAELPRSARRTFALDALLARYAELDPAAAVSYAQEVELDADFLKTLYQAWARADAEGALRALGTYARNRPGEFEARTTHALALAIVEVLGDAEPVIERLLDSLPQIDPSAFRADIIAASATASPEAALRQALGMSDRVARRLAVQRVAQAWSRENPLAAVNRIETIEDLQLRGAFEEVVLREWAQLEPEAVLEHLIEASQTRSMGRIGFATSAIAVAARANPLRVLELASRLPSPTDDMATQIALQTLAEDDPMLALRYVESRPATPMRQSHMHIIASAYGRHDTDAALEWARELEPQNPGLLASTLAGVAQVDFERALDLALAQTQPARMQSMQSVIMSLMGTGGRGQFAKIAERLLADSDAQAAQTLNMLTSVWASAEPEAALEWLLANSDGVGNRGWQSAMQLASRSPALAARYTLQVPDEVRPSWIVSVAQGYAQTAAPDEALSWITQFRNESGYEEGVAAIAQTLAQSDPLRAARVLDGIDAESQAAMLASTTVATAWAAQDPSAAAEWARGLQTEVRGMAVRGIAQQWGAQDHFSARNWALGLTGGNERDGALNALIASSPLTLDELTNDSVLMNAFSSDHARQSALLSGIFRMGQRDIEAARGMIDDHITDPGLRQQAEQMLSPSRVNLPAVISRGRTIQGISPAFFIP